MFCTDSLEDVAVHPGLNATQRIPAQDIHVACLGQLIAEFFDVNRCLCVTLCPQEMAHFSENGNAGLFSPRSLGCGRNETAEEFQKSNWIRYAIDHECRERVRSIHRDVSPLLKSGAKIRAICLQSLKKAVPV